MNVDCGLDDDPGKLKRRRMSPAGIYPASALTSLYEESPAHDRLAKLAKRPKRRGATNVTSMSAVKESICNSVFDGRNLADIVYVIGHIDKYDMRPLVNTAKQTTTAARDVKFKLTMDDHLKYRQVADVKLRTLMGWVTIEDVLLAEEDRKSQTTSDNMTLDEFVRRCEFPGGATVASNGVQYKQGKGRWSTHDLTHVLFSNANKKGRKALTQIFRIDTIGWADSRETKVPGELNLISLTNYLER